MRSSLIALLGTVALAQAAQAQVSPGVMSITAQDVDVRSGPTEKYYATSKLRMGENVYVTGESKLDKGWLAIFPPRGSFSWINEKYLTPIDAYTGAVKQDAKIRVGSLLDNRPPDVEPELIVRQGTQVKIIGKAQKSDSGTWYPIEPVDGEVRYIRGDSVHNRQDFASASKSGSTPLPGQPAATVPSANWVPGQLAPGQLASLTKPAPAPTKLPATWSQVGVLRRAADSNGQATYIIMDSKNNVLLYAVCQPGFTLKDYVGRTVSLYGSISYQSDDYMRRQYMTASLVAVY